jgi:hypothetical protein
MKERPLSLTIYGLSTLLGVMAFRRVAAGGAGTGWWGQTGGPARYPGVD